MPEAKQVNINELDILGGDESGLVAIAKAKQSDRPIALKDYRAEVGTTGLHIFGGRVNQEFLMELQGLRGYRIFEEMRKNDPVVGSTLFATEQSIRRVNWFSESPENTDEYKKAKDLLDTAKDDMSHTWNDHISEALTLLPFGYSVFETVYKERKGRDGDPSSRYNDGLIAWRKFGYRPPDTIEKWDMDENGGIKGFWQRDIYYGKAPVFIPIEKMIHYRTKRERNNPEGTALSPETPIPTPDGWKTMGDLREGDKIFDENGRIRYVIATAEWENRPRYKLTFSSGDTIIADENHIWATCTAKERTRRFPHQLRTTKEIAETSRVVMNKGDGTEISNHSIHMCKPLDMPEQMLPIDPYIFGMWLGDGSSRSGVITNADAEVGSYFKAAGYGVTQKLVTFPDNYPDRKDVWNWRLISTNGNWETGNLSEQLRVNGFIMNKHIPQGYMRGSYDQRLKLLQGLMDSDGYINKSGRCEFYNTNLGLCEGVQELVRSLGTNAYITEKHPDKDFPDRKQRYIVKFTPIFSSFRIERKSIRQKPDDSTFKKNPRWHYITKTEKLDSGPTKCIQVDSPSGLFLAGKSFVPTHNSMLRNAYRPYFFKKELEKFEAIALERTGAGIPVIKLPLGYTNADLEAAKRVVRRIRVDEQMGVTLPPGWELLLLRPEGRAETQTYEMAINRYSNHILMSLLTTFIAIGTNNVGSFALVRAQQDFYRLALVGIVGNMRETLNRYAVEPMFALNAGSFSEQIISNPPQLQTSDIGEHDLEVIGNFINQVGKAGFLTPDDKLENFIRMIADFPALDDVSDTSIQRDDLRQAAFQLVKPKPSQEEINLSEKNAAAQAKAAALRPSPFGGPAKTPSKKTPAKVVKNDREIRERMRMIKYTNGGGEDNIQNIAAINDLIKESFVELNDERNINDSEDNE